MVNVSTYAGFLITGMVLLAIISIIAAVFSPEAPAAPAQKKLTSKFLPLGFDISNLRETQSVELPGATLINGLLFGSNALTRNLPLPPDTENVRLSFDVVRTNLYAPLTVSVDSQKQSRKLPKGRYAFDLGRREGSVLISIHPESSAWRIWAPGLYEINNTLATISSFKPETSEFDFALDKELPAESASLVLQIEKSEGSLSVGLNGKDLHRGSLQGVQTIPINASLLSKENKIVFNATRGSQYSGSGTLVINYMA